MAFQANTWGLKALAARVLLAPLLAGSLGAMAIAQTPPASTPAAVASGSAAAAETKDPKELLKFGRKALAQGDFDSARDFVRRAEANNPSGRWGLTGDTPESLLKDIQSARAKANRSEIEQLTRQAKELAGRSAKSDQEKLANLEQAAALIDRACSLHGPGSWVADLNPFAEKPEAVKRDIDAARMKLRKSLPAESALSPAPRPSSSQFAPPAPVPQPLANRPLGVGTGRIPAAPAAPATRPLDLQAPRQDLSQAAAAKKQAALKLIAEGQALLAAEKFAEARAAFLEADKLGVAFSVHEENPGRGIVEATSRGKAKINQLVATAQDYANKRDWSHSIACMSQARSIAVGLELRTATIDEDMAQLAAFAKQDGVVLTQAADVPPLPGFAGTEPEMPKVPGASSVPSVPSVPSMPSVPSVPSVPMTPPMSVPDSPKLPGAPKVEPELPSTPKPMDSSKFPFDPDVSLPELPGSPGKEPAKPMDPLLKDPGKAPMKDPVKDPVKTPVEPAKPTPTDLGMMLIKDASKALEKGELDQARELATKAHTGGYGETVKREALKLIREVEAEENVAKKKDAAEGLKAAMESFKVKQYEHAATLLSRIPTDLLTPEQQKLHDKLTRDTADMIAKLSQPMPPAPMEPKPNMAAAQPSDPGKIPLIPSTPTPGTPAAPAPGTPAPPVKLSEQLGALAEVEFQQLRDEGFRVETQAKQAYEKGETDVAMQMLADFIAKVNSSKLSSHRKQMLLTPVERRLSGFAIMKSQVDFYAKEAKAKKQQIETRLAKASAEQQKQDAIASNVRQIQELSKLKKYKDAESLALQTKELDPENATLNLIYMQAKMAARVAQASKDKADREEFVLNGLNSSDRQGPFVDTMDPIAVNIDRARKNKLRAGGDDFYLRTRTPIEREIELKLEKPLKLEFQNAPMREVISKFREVGQLNIVIDDAALNSEGIELDKLTITEKIDSPISMRSVMNIMFQKHGLQQVVEDDVVKVTTTKRAKGRLYTKVFSVTDLVTPIPDFALPEHAVLSKAMERGMNSLPWMNNGPQPAPGGLPNGQLVGTQPGFSGGRFDPNGANTLQNTSMTTPGTPQLHPLSASAHLAPTRVNAAPQLMKLITGMVRPYSWQEMGGPGKIDYYDVGGALVVNQTADVIKEITDLLESLRRLQDLSIAVEIRVVSLSEDWFERVGVDFAMNVKTNNNLNFERQLVTGQFRPEPFLNSIEARNTVVGWIPPAGGFTSDLKLPIRPNTYGFSVPPFGNYTGNLNSGLNLGLAFLNDIQVYLFMEASSGNRRINVMQAPKITLFNGQTSTVSVQDFQYFTTGLTITNVGGQYVYLPQNTPMPVGGGGGFGGPGVTIAVQGVVSSDRRFVRMTLTPSFTVLSSATVPLFPITAFITPVFEGGSQGVPIPFTQFFQQPAFQVISVQTTVAVPDGGTVLMGGLKTMSEGRNEFGPPVVSQIPYLNRLFKNTGIGRESRHIMLMVTPRIIINLDEELAATGVQ